jgi:glutathione synthase/RimK-type ligase-like ATP-grasp enzyme
MILLWGVAEDSPLKATWAALERRDAAVFFLDQRRAAETRIELGADAQGEIRLGAERCDLSRVTGVYVRCGESSALTPGADQDAALDRHAHALDATVAAFLDATPARVVNPLEAMASNGSKPYQLALIRAQGFCTPDTLATTDPAAVREFLARHGQSIYKSLSGVRSIVARLSPAHLERLADIAWCPTQFQQYVPGRDYRVHVIGEAVFASEIVCEADDYRYAGREGDAVDLNASALPEALAERCRSLAGALGLAAAGVDLRLTPGGEWVCFEVNPAPAFTYYEEATGQPMADAMAALLVDDAGPPTAFSRVRHCQCRS